MVSLRGAGPAETSGGKARDAGGRGHARVQPTRHQGLRPFRYLVPYCTKFPSEPQPGNCMLAAMTPPLPLAERKRRQARQRIIQAAEELFLARGFDDVSVADIAECAEVGRTTFFRHLSDLLIHRGTDKATALLAAQVALACYQTAKRLASNPRTLVDETEAALKRVLTLGTRPAETRTEPPAP